MRTLLIFEKYETTNFDVCGMRRYNWNILQWNKNDIKSMRMTTEKRLRLTALHGKLTLGGEKNSRRYPPLALTSLSLHFCQSGLSSKAQSPTMKLTFASFSHSTTIRDILRFLSENEALINNRFSIRSSGSLRLDSKIRRLRHGTWQMILYLSTLSLGIITFCGTAVSNVSHILSLSLSLMDKFD